MGLNLRGVLWYFCYPILRHYEYKYGIHLNINIPVGKGLMIVHGDGVYLNCKEIGNYFTVYQNVTLGSDKGGIPTVGNHVTVYVGAIVVGDVFLGDGCSIGANAFLTKAKVEEGALYAGVPAKRLR